MEQVHIPELDDFIEFGIPWAPYAIPAEGEPALVGSVAHLNSGLNRYKRLAELLGDYQQKLRPRHDIRNQIFRVDEAVRPAARVPEGEASKVVPYGALTEDQALGYMDDVGRLGDMELFRRLSTE